MVDRDHRAFRFCHRLAIGIPAFMPTTPGVTYANYSRIEEGMTREQVEGLLGEPNAPKMLGMYTTGVGPRDPHAPATSLYWRTDDGDEVEAGFDHDGHVVLAAWNTLQDDRTAFEKLRDRLPWLRREPPPPMQTK
jgi:hypothetical protein